MTVFTVIPAVMLGNLGGDLSRTLGLNSTLLSAILGGMGGMIGYGLYFFTKHLNTAIKISILVALFAMLAVGIRVILAQPTDKELIEQEWINQKIGTINFESPSKLKLASASIPQGTEQFYGSLEVYTDENNDRTTSFMNAKILVDTLNLAESFGGSLEGMLNNIGITEVELLEDHYMDSEEVVAKFKFQLDEQEVIGFGYMRNVGRTLQSIWLMPIKQGFSLEYIDKFELAIEPE
ncbi:hypothetical protein SAMN04488028_102240 [Reichenbachiella agariperforans]|uniref:Uncharacterized protein n=2 Tax=Reichenbachiella agariperforans TaxID=156994 RepID=A0A1M6NFZ9_REIAG|nr:hypothetical protein SAMN04488028_102240 [Reichenbachiella agariperforans]